LLADTEYNNEEVKKLGSLTGKTLLVYWTLLKSGSYLGVREIQRKLNFSSPSVASYHLEKLNDLELVEKDITGAYIVKKKADIAELNDIIVFRLAKRVILLPRFIFYAIFLTVMLIGYFLFLFPNFIFVETIFVLIMGLTSASFFWWETFRIYKNKPLI
jgi:DNA-binding transcriptional ArsR family regulator